MAYNPDAHQRLEALSEKYHDWYMSRARLTRDPGRPVLNADGIESTLAECYEDAMVTAHALYVYLVENPAPHGRPPSEVVQQPVPPPVQHHVPPSVDVLGDAHRRQRW
jgi:hypothetical protein